MYPKPKFSVKSMRCMTSCDVTRAENRRFLTIFQEISPHITFLVANYVLSAYNRVQLSSHAFRFDDIWRKKASKCRIFNILAVKMPKLARIDKIVLIWLLIVDFYEFFQKIRLCQNTKHMLG